MNCSSILRIAFAGSLLGLAISVVSAQDKPEKGAIKLELSFLQKNEEMPELRVSTKTKIKKKFKPASGVAVNIFMGTESAQGFLGRVVTKADGVNTLVLPESFKKMYDSEPVAKFVATVTGNKLFEDASAEIEITKAKIELSVNEKDSTRTITAKVLAKKDSGWAPVSGTELKFAVKRSFNDILVSESATSTDDQGVASTDFKLTIPGDTEGNIFIAAKIEENETYGNIQTTKLVKWGTPVEKDNHFYKRTLFATRGKTPLWLLIFPNIIIITVWGFIGYLIYLIFRIRKLGATEPNNLN